MTTSVSLAQAEPTCFPMSLANPLVPAPPITALSPGMECFAWIRDLKDALADRAFTARGAGGLTLTTTSPVPSGVASKAVLSQPACGTMLLQPSSASTSTQPITAPSRPYHQSGGPHPREISREEGEGACSPDNVNTSYTISARMMMTPSMVPSSSPSPPCPISYASVVLSSMGGSPQPSSPVFPATAAHESAAITLRTRAHRHKRRRCCPGQCNVPRTPNPPDEAFPSHPLPMMGEASMPTTTTHVTSARANNWDHRLNMSSPTLPPMTLPSPSLQPFTIKFLLRQRHPSTITEVFTTKAPSSSRLSASRPLSPQFAGVSLRTPTLASGPQHLTRGLLSGGQYHSRFIGFKYLGNPSGRQCFLTEVYLLSSLPIFFFFFLRLHFLF